MASPIVERLLAQQGGPRDGALLRFSIANALLADADVPGAIAACRAAVGFDPAYSAAWKLLGKLLAQDGDTDAAIAAYDTGIAVAHARGDKQAEKEMRVFLRRLQAKPSN